MTPDDEYEDIRANRADGAHPFTKDAGEPLPPETSDEARPETGDAAAWDPAGEMRPETGTEDLRDTRDEDLRDTRDEVVPLDARDEGMPRETGAGAVLPGREAEDLAPADRPYASSNGEQAVNVTELGPVFDPANASDFQQRWRSIQSEFVEDPHESVRLAKDLTDEILSSLTLALQDRRQTLDASARNGDTEQLRLVLRQYREVLEGVTSL